MFFAAAEVAARLRSGPRRCAGLVDGVTGELPFWVSRIPAKIRGSLMKKSVGRSLRLGPTMLAEEVSVSPRLLFGEQTVEIIAD